MIPDLWSTLKYSINEIYHSAAFFFRYKLWCKDYRYEENYAYYSELCENKDNLDICNHYCDWEYCPKLHKIDGEDA